MEKKVFPFCLYSGTTGELVPLHICCLKDQNMILNAFPVILSREMLLCD